jgi:SAM-dependent methyltransferase
VSRSAHWSRIARRWDQVGPPLRPSPEDCDAYLREIAAVPEGHAIRALVLGVTPELWRLPWPPGTDVISVDRSHDMIAALWPGPRAVRADWMSLPLLPASRDIALCDGGLHLLSYPEGQARMLRELARVLEPNGILTLRLFAPPPEGESAEVVIERLLNGGVHDINALKIRLTMALHEDPRSGVELAGVWNVLHAAAPNLDALADKLGWRSEHIHTIDTYRDCTDRYSFVRIGELADLLGKREISFTIDALHTPSYPLGDRFPIVRLRRV